MSLVLKARRACVLEGQTEISSIRRGYVMLRDNLKDMALMGVVILGIQGIWPIVVVMALLLSFSGGLLVSALPASMFANLSDPATLPAAILGGSFFLLLVVGPLVFLEGLLEALFSTIWTLAYRHLNGLESATEQVSPAPSMPDTALPVPSA